MAKLRKDKMAEENTQESPVEEQAGVTVTDTSKPVAAPEVQSDTPLHGIVYKIEAELEALGSIKSMFHVAEVKGRIKALIVEAKTLL
jgi:hypothetical protein